MQTSTQKLIDTLLAHCDYIPGEIQTNSDGERYLYDCWRLKYPHASNWLVKLFGAAATESGYAYHDCLFRSGNYSFHYDRNPMKGQPNGRIRMKLLTIESAENLFTV